MTKTGASEKSYERRERSVLRRILRFAPHREGSSSQSSVIGEASADYRAPTDALGLQAPTDFLWLWLRTADPAYVDLYRGVCLFEIVSAPPGVCVRWDGRAEMLLEAVDDVHPLSAKQRTTLLRLLEDVHYALPSSRKDLREIRVLFVGDCLLEEVALFLASECVKDGLLVRPQHVISKNPMEQRRQLRELSSASLFAVLYSPFTYSFDLDFAEILDLSSARASAQEIDEAVTRTINTVSQTIDVLSRTFECPVFVNNTAALQRGKTYLHRFVKGMATKWARTRARKTINAWLPSYLELKNRETFRHMFLVDEAAVVPTESARRELGGYFYTTRGLHPTRFSRRLAAEFSEHVQAADLCGKKLVICDLDNTLWEGVIGEGLGIRHYRDRQQLLLRLKEKGIVLAIASKNDPAKVTWYGGVLDGDCFVAAKISWAPKVQGIQRIYRDLNIKAKDGVFIDDRPDEREMVQTQWPEMTVLDPCVPRTWRVLARWADILDDEQEFDRTAMYQQREQRKGAAFLTQDIDPAETFARLNLKATLCEADRSALKRVSELINRTNQWNLAGSRTNYREVERWYLAADHTIYTVQLDDRFGSIGTVCVAVVRIEEQHFEIPVFVLSCRAFGFGVETLILEHLKGVAQRRFGVPSLRGIFTPTEYNAPCREMYREHGFVQSGDGWTYPGGISERKVPSWIKLSGGFIL